MEAIADVLMILLAVVASTAIGKMLPAPIPLPLVQIVLGAALAAFADLEVPLDPDIFFLLFIPPLLFLDGWRIPKQSLFRDAATCLELALGLVVFTVVGIGLFIHWMIPPISLPVAFALAAVLSPTDPVAVSAITSRVPIPPRVMHILEGESLLNDASGIVCMRVALAAALTGTFSIVEATGSFLWVALGGIVIGAAVTGVITRAKYWVSRSFGEDTGAQILVSLLIPFSAYLAAEHLHCSGILSAVAAGITMSYAEISDQAHGETRLQRTAVWNTVQVALNGAIFVILGEQLPRILSGAFRAVRQAEHSEVWLLAIYVAAIAGALVALRLLWVWTSLRLTLYRAARQGVERRAPPFRLVAAVSLAGVRGAITLAGVLTFPLVTQDGSPFPARDLAIFLAAGVIVLSLIVASISLPRLLVDLPLPPEDRTSAELREIRATAAKSAIRAIQAAQHRLAEEDADAKALEEAASRALEVYGRRLEDVEGSGNAPDLIEMERQLRLAGLRAERQEIFRQAQSRMINDALARRLIRELDLAEARLAR